MSAKLIRPIKLLDSTLIASNVAETSPATNEWSNVTPVSIGDVVTVTSTAAGASIATHTVYTANLAHTGKDPTLIVNQGSTDGVGNGWDITDATNRWRAFNGVIQQATTNADSITYEILPGLVNAVALIGAKGISARIRLNDPIDGDVYDETVDLTSFSGIQDWHAYFFTPIEQTPNVAKFDLPSFPTATLFITIDNTGGTAEVGEVVFGTQFLLGDTDHGAAFSIKDFSEKITAANGAVTIKKGAFQDVADLDIKILTSRAPEVRRLLTSLRSTPILWIAEETDPSTLIFGYFISFDVIIATPTIADCLLLIEGLI